jgi:hypothetical protein
MECFGGCFALANSEFATGSKLQTIPPAAFASCLTLRWITIPSSVKSSGEWCFAHFQKLSEIQIESPSQRRPIQIRV